MNPQDARAALDAAETAAAALRRSARWLAIYMAVFGIGFGVITVVIGLIGPSSIAIVMTVWVVLIMGMQRWAMTRLAHPGGGVNRRTAVFWIGSGALYGLALFVGITWMPGQVAFWLGAGVIVSLPLLFGAWREWRR